MNAGALKYRIQVLRPINETTDYGTQKQVFVNKTSCRCAVKHNPSTKTEDLDEVVYRQYKTLQVYRYVDVQEEDRIVFEGKQYHITSIDEEPEYNRKNITITLVND